MATARFVASLAWARKALCVLACLAFGSAAHAAGTPVGTIIENTATVEFDLAGTPVTLQSNTTTITVVERIDVVVALQSPQQLVPVIHGYQYGQRH